VTLPLSILIPKKFEVAMIRAAAIATVTAITVITPAIAQSFRGYPCTVDCSGHNAGYDWAEENDISDASDCNGNSASFNEGCEAYVEETEAQSAAGDDTPEGE